MERPTARRGTRQRHDALLSLLRQGMTRVDELSTALAVSASTVRRDLTRLDAQQLVARTYGGAMVPETFQERPVADSARVQAPAKAAIAQAAATMIPAQATVFLDAGTTCAALARLLASGEHHGELSVVTRGLEAVNILVDSEVDVIMLGGLVRSMSHGTIGPLVDSGVERMSFEIAFMGADAVDLRRGIGEPTLDEVAVKERVADRARQVVVLADSTKLSGPSAPAWTRFAPGWTLVTDCQAPIEVEHRAGETGVKVVRAAAS